MPSNMTTNKYAGRRIDAYTLNGDKFHPPKYIKCNVSNTYVLHTGKDVTSEYLYKGIEYAGDNIIAIYESDGATVVGSGDITLIY